jgi:NADH-quinone oxidoreductase subunit L
MLVPLFVLAVGALLAGMVFKDFFFGDHYEAFWKGALFTGAENHILERIAPCSAVGRVVAVRGHAAGPLPPGYFYIRSPETAGSKLARGIRPSTSSCSTSGISTSSTISSSSALRSGSAASCGSRVMAVIDGSAPTALPRGCRTSPAGLWLQTGYVYHYAFVMLIGIAALVTWMMLGSALMTGWYLLSRHLPAAGRCVLFLLPDRMMTRSAGATSVRSRAWNDRR